MPTIDIEPIVAEVKQEVLEWLHSGYGPLIEAAIGYGIAHLASNLAYKREILARHGRTPVNYDTGILGKLWLEKERAYARLMAASISLACLEFERKHGR